jgi:hypothetical protein
MSGSRTDLLLIEQNHEYAQFCPPEHQNFAPQFYAAIIAEIPIRRISLLSGVPHSPQLQALSLVQTKVLLQSRAMELSAMPRKVFWTPGLPRTVAPLQFAWTPFARSYL